MIFVFGSNLAGRHGKGAALHAKENHNARQGIGEGRTGNAYGIPTKDHNLNVRTLLQISNSVKKFINYAEIHFFLDFKVTKIGCGLAGYTEEEIKPFFKNAPSNCYLPEGW